MRQATSVRRTRRNKLPRSSRKLPHRRPLGCEWLENRCLLATFMVDALGDETESTDGVTTLREAVNQANAAAGADDIRFDPDVISGSFIYLDQGELNITDSLSIHGLGTTLMGINAERNDSDPDVVAGDGSRVFNISDGDPATNIEVSISDMQLTGADSPGLGGAVNTQESTTFDNVIIFNNAAAMGGGAVSASIADGATLTIRNSTLRDNTSGTDGGAVLANARGADITINNSTISGNTADQVGGGIYLNIESTESGDPTVSIADSEIRDNSATDGGGIALASLAGAATIANSNIVGNTVTEKGGGIHASINSADATVEVRDSTVSGNMADQGGGLYANSLGTLGIARSTISENSAAQSGGGLDVVVAGLSVVDIDASTIARNRSDKGTGGGVSAIFTDGTPQVNVFNSTLSSNSARISGGLDARGAGGKLNTAHSTVSFNTSTDGNAAVAIRDASADLQHTIIAANNGAGAARDLSFSGANRLTVGFSLIGNNDGTGLTEAAPDANGNLIGGSVGGIIDPLLGSLGPYGGTTDTHPLLTGSPAIDAGAMGSSEFDQRGTPFVRVFDGSGDGIDVADIGAVERIRSTLIVDIAEDESDGDYSFGDLSLREAVALAADSTATSGIVTFDPSLSGAAISLTRGEIAIRHEVRVQGPGANLLSVVADDPTPDDLIGDGSRIFNIDDEDDSRNLSVVIEGLTLSGGDVTGGGGAIRSLENLTVQSMVVSGNHAAVSVDDLAFEGDGGAIWARTETGEVRILDSTISGNVADDDGGGLNLLAGNGLVVVSNSTVSGNTANGLSNLGRNLGGGIRGFSEPGGELVIVDSDVSDNSGQTSGPGEVFRGSGIGFLSTDNNDDGRGDGRFRLERSTVSGSTGAFFGGGIYTDGIASISRSAVTGNSAVYGGGVNSVGNALTISDSTISGNDASALGGGLFNNVATVIERTTIDGNTAANGAGVLNLSSLEITDSTISNNAATSIGGGLYNGLLIQQNVFVGVFHILSSTISGNQADTFAGGIFTIGDPGSPSTLVHSTVSNNTADADEDGAGSAGGFYALLGQLDIDHSILAANQGGLGVADLQIDPTGIGGQTANVNVTNSLIGDNSGNGLIESSTPGLDGNLVGGPVNGVIDPLLGPLEDNGGPTMTQALLAGSPAIDTGQAAVLNPPAFDQRGVPFVRVFGDRIDMGAFEVQPLPLTGDFNNDGAYTCEDIDALVVHIADNLSDPAFDLNDDGTVDTLDIDVWLALAGAENLPSGRPILQGDANLDGRVNVSDLNIVGVAWLSDVRGWCAGDFTANGRVEVSDLNRVGVSWQLDVSGDAAAASVGRTPRAPLAAHIAAPDKVEAVVDVVFAQQLSKSLKSPVDPPHVVPPKRIITDSREGLKRLRHSQVGRSQTVGENSDDQGETTAINDVDIVDLLLVGWDC